MSNFGGGAQNSRVTKFLIEGTSWPFKNCGLLRIGHGYDQNMDVFLLKPAPCINHQLLC